jgi:hypothetical protein
MVSQDAAGNNPLRLRDVPPFGGRGGFGPNAEAGRAKSVAGGVWRPIPKAAT